ncbi:MAG: DCC1-like thiol-disulfide oxidoreductase family protein [Paracoccaceae bacterium]
MPPVMPPVAKDQDLILFDAQCVFCSGFARFMHARDTAHRFRFVTAQSATGRALYQHHALDPDLMETNIVIVDGIAYVKLRAFAAAMRSLGAPWSVLGMLAHIPRRLSDWIYDRIARNRYRFGRHACPMPPPDLKARLIE